MKSPSWNMLSLRSFLFFFLSGVGCLFPFLSLHMKVIGLTATEAHIISIVVPIIAAVGPLIVCPLADRLGGGPGSRSLRSLLAFTIFLAAVSYALLMCVPQVQRLKSHKPRVNFSCDPQGALVLQEQCMEPACYHWSEEQSGHLILSDCHYECHAQPKPASLDQTPEEETDSILPHTTDMNHDYEASGNGPMEVELEKIQAQEQEEDEDQAEDQYNEETTTDGETRRKKRNVLSLSNHNPPHLCSSDEDDKRTCYVYTNASGNITIEARLLPAINADTIGEEWCQYPLARNFSCRIPSELQDPDGQLSCQVICSLPDPYSSEANILAKSQCRRMIGDSTVTFWSYLVVRSVADLFSTTAIGLMDAAVVIATRETNVFRGDVGRELMWGTLGYTIFAPILGYLNTAVKIAEAPSYWLSFTICLIFMTVATIILLFSHSMPLSRPEWWSRHARVMPFGGLKRHVGEISAFSFIVILLGAFWSALDHYLPWHVANATSSDLYIGLSVLLGSLPAILFLWNSEKIVYYCGHSNLLIMAFTFYIIRYIVECIQNYWVSFGCDALQIFTLSLAWVTIILYARQLVPRHLTVTGQGMAVVFHFCIGHCIGAAYAAIVHSYSSTDQDHLIRLYQVGAVAAAVVAIVYFIIYHCCLKPCCQGSAGSSPKSPAGVTQGPTTNGTYTPLRVYHNGSGQKGGHA